jgi:hypothetical protein
MFSRRSLALTLAACAWLGLLVLAARGLWAGKGSDLLLAPAVAVSSRRLPGASASAAVAVAVAAEATLASSPPPPPARRIAFATLDVTPADRWEAPALWIWGGVIAWAQSLRETGTAPLGGPIDLVVMTLNRSTTLAPGTAALYAQLGIKVGLVESW